MSGVRGGAGGGGGPIRHCRRCLARLPPVRRVMKAGLIFTDTPPFQSPVGGPDTDTFPVGEGAGPGGDRGGTCWQPPVDPPRSQRDSSDGLNAAFVLL